MPETALEKEQTEISSEKEFVKPDDNPVKFPTIKPSQQNFSKTQQRDDIIGKKSMFANI